MSNSRLEKFIYAICGMDVDDLPTPLSRIETLWNCLIIGEVPDFEPLSRNEKYLMAMLTDDVDGLPEPTSRSEKLLYKIATGETDLSDVPGYLSRYEELLKRLIENGGIGGTDFEYVLYTLNQPLSTLYSTAEDIVNTATIYGNTLVNTLQEPSDLAVTPIGENIDISNITVDGTVEGKVKSAILKGQTLVNCINLKTKWFSSETNLKTDSPTDVELSQYQRASLDVSMLKSNQKYYVLLIVDYTMTNGVNSDVFLQLNTMLSNSLNVLFRIRFNTLAKPTIITTGELTDLSKSYIFIGGKSCELNIRDIKIMLIEYQDGMENWDIPYFEGMQSVKMPVLTTCGKNLFDINKPFNLTYSYNNQGAEVVVDNNRITTIGLLGVVSSKSQYYNLKTGVTYTFSATPIGTDFYIRIYDNQKFSDIASGRMTKDVRNSITFTLSNTKTSDLRIVFHRAENVEGWLTEIQLEENTQATTYEPYKTNILSCNEEVTLRGIGEVKDELNCLTGEVVENTIKLTFSGIENWETSANLTNYMTFRLAKPSNMITADSHSSASKYVCDKLQIVSSNTVGSTEIEAIWFSSNHMYIRLPKTKASSLEEFKTYLSTNNIQVVSCVKQPTIKTVVLSTLDQDGQPTKLKTFNDVTHVSIESDGLIPTVDLEVPTKIEETLSTLPTLMNDISETQQLLNESIDDQAENINEVSTAITEIHNDIL